MIDRIYDLLLGALARLYMTIDELKWRRLRGLAQRGTRSVRYFNANGGRVAFGYSYEPSDVGATDDGE